MFSSLGRQDLIDVAKVSPPVTVGVSIVQGVDLSDVVLLITLAYTLVQVYLTIKRHRREEKEYELERQRREDARARSVRHRRVDKP